MGWWQLNADTLARSRFALSPLAETFASLKLLHSGAGAHPGESRWLAAHLPAYRALLADDPVTGLLVRAGLGKEWIADFLTPTPRGGEVFEAEVARVRGATGARDHLRMSLGGPLPRALDRDDLPERAAVLLEWVWEQTVRPYWERRRRVLEADVNGRVNQVSRGGWAAVLDSLRPGTRWLGESRFQINRHEYPPREISGAELVFVPVTPRAGWVSWDDGERYAVVYPCAGVLAGAEPPGEEPLRALLGAGRARVLVLLGRPMSTTQLVAVTGQGLGAVGRHLRVLWDAGLVERRRVGRSVLYVRTGVGDGLVNAGGRAGGTGAGRGTWVPGRASRGGVSIRSMTIDATSPLNVEIESLKGDAADLAQYAGQAVLIVNVASKCGLTPQYAGLEKLQERYAAQGFTVLGVPCNQFLGQEPGSAVEIAEFCSATYGVTFPMTEKVEVNGEGRHALYERLVGFADGEGHTGDIRWNFEKFLIGRDGSVVARFSPQTEPESAEVVAAVEAQLAS